MIRGCHKSIVFLKDTGSELFEEAYFILKPNTTYQKENDIVSEATKLVNGLCKETNNRREKRRRRLGILLGFLLGMACGCGAMLTLYFTII